MSISSEYSRSLTQHSACAATGTRTPRARRARICNLLLLVGGRTAADGSSGTTWGRRAGRATDAGAGGGAGIGGGGRTGRRLFAALA